MSDLFDLEAEMAEDTDRMDRAQRAKERIARGAPRPVSRETRDDMARTAWLQKQNPRAVPIWLKQMEDDLLKWTHN